MTHASPMSWTRKALLLINVCCVVSVLHAADAHDSLDILGQVPNQLEAFVTAGEISGAVTLVACKDHAVRIDAVGFADVDARRPMQRDTVFAIASMTKPITATAIMILQEDGKLSVDDPVSRYLPEFGDVVLEDGSRPPAITIRHLLSHMAGLGGSQKNEGSLKSTVEQLAKQPLLYEPGSGWKYSSSLTVCGRVVEVISGMPFQQFLQERIFAPLGMVDTTFFPTAKQQRRLAKIYEPGPEQGSLRAVTHWITDLSDDRSPNPSAGLFSTAFDLLRFHQMILNGGELEGMRIASERTIRAMATMQTGDLKTSRPGLGWGLGFQVVKDLTESDNPLPPGSIGHGGALGTQAWIDPKRRAVYLFLIQRTNFGSRGGPNLTEAFHLLATTACSAASE